MEIMHYVDKSEFQIVNNDSDESEENYEKEVKEVDMYHCDKCDKLFSSLRSLKNHLISHTDRFQCSNCYQARDVDGVILLQQLIYKSLFGF